MSALSRPVSSDGRNPIGILVKSQTVSSVISSVTTIVVRRYCSTCFRERWYRCSMPSKKRSMVMYRRP